MPDRLLPYFSYRDELTIQDGIIFRGERIVIPSSLRKSMKEKVHAGHIGINSSLRRARDLIYWPQMFTHIRHYVETCGVCATYADKQPAESMVMTETPDLPWQKVGTDLLSWSERDYMVTTDYRSGFFELDYLPDTTSTISVDTAYRTHLSVTMDHSMHRLCSENSHRTGSLCTRLAPQATAKPMVQPKRRSRSLRGC